MFDKAGNSQLPGTSIRAAEAQSLSGVFAADSTLSIPALREFDLCWLSRAQGWLALMALAVLSLPSKLLL